MSKPNVGFIGLGIMGAPMAGHIASAGHQVSVYDINIAYAEKLAAEHDNIQIMDTPKALAEVSEIVITMLPSGEYVQEAALGENGLIHGLAAGSLLLDTSSCEPWLTIETARRLAEKGIKMVDAPVSGAQAGAINAELVFMLGGDNESIERVTPLLDLMGRQKFHLGPTGAGHAVKCINNLITSVNLLALAEGMVIGKKFGLDPNIMSEVIDVSTGGSWVNKTHIKQRIISRKFDDPFKLGLMVKDIGIAMKLAKDLDLSLELTSLNQQMWESAQQHAGKDSSVSNLVKWVEDITDTEITAD